MKTNGCLELPDGDPCVMLEELEKARAQIEEMARRKEILEKHKTAIIQGKDGRWRTRIKDGGKWRMLCRTYRTDLIDDLVEFYQASEERRTIGEACAEWLAEKEKYGEITQASLTRYRNDAARFFKAECRSDKRRTDEAEPDDRTDGAAETEAEAEAKAKAKAAAAEREKRLGEIRKFCEADLSGLNDGMMEEFIKASIKEHGLTAKTYGGLRILLDGSLRFAKSHGYTKFSVGAFFADFKPPKRVLKQTERKTDEEDVFSEEEAAAMIRHCEERGGLLYLGVDLMFWSGVRVSELSALRWSAVDIKNRELTIAATEVQYDETGRDGKKHRVVTVQDMPKTEAGERTVYLPPEAVPVLRRIRESSPFGAEFVFSRPDGSRIRSKSFNDATKRICRQIGIPERSSHKIRKTYASSLVDAGVPEKITMKQLGHKDYATTKRYYDRFRKSEEAVRDAIDKAVSYK